MTADVAAMAHWYAYTLWCALRDMWRDLPGPWPVKVLILLLVLALTQALPGQLDDALVWGGLRKACKAWNARQAVKANTISEGN